MSELEERVEILEQTLDSMGQLTPREVEALQGLLTEFQYLRGRVTALEATLDKQGVQREPTRFDLAEAAKKL